MKNIFVMSFQSFRRIEICCLEKYIWGDVFA